jgi:hypothetical protein
MTFSVCPSRPPPATARPSATRRLTTRREIARVTDDIATSDPLTPPIYSHSGIATLIDVNRRVPTMDEFDHARPQQPARHTTPASAASMGVGLPSSAPPSR